VRVSDRMAAGSKQHFYRLTIGVVPYVTGIFPLGVPANETSAVQLIGWNLETAKRGGANGEIQKLTRTASAAVKTGAPGEVEVPIDTEAFRSRRNFKVMASSAPELLEAEPNDAAPSANPIQIPGAVNGRFWSVEHKADSDLFRFHVAAGRPMNLEPRCVRRDGVSNRQRAPRCARSVAKR